jgi:hypothetical protein
MSRFHATAEGNIPFTAEEEAQRDAEEAAFAAKQAANGYKRDRAAEYPPVGDQLDALWKGGEAAAAMLAQVQAVKAKYPKPE